MQRILSFEQTPSLSVPLRFFMTAPLFATLAAILLFWHGPDALVSRWSPSTLALTHLLTLGFLSMTMAGALIQILQVVIGIDLPWPRTTAAVVHGLLTLGCLLLVAGFLLFIPVLFKLALASLMGAFLWLLVASGAGLWRIAQPSPIVVAIRLALAALAVTAALGAAAASAFAWSVALPLIEITNLHAAWGLLAWVGLLIIGVAFQVVPMFQVTPVYPKLVTRWLAWSIFLLLAIWSAAFMLPAGISAWLAPLSSGLLGMAFLAFGVVTLHLLKQRKRPQPDATTLFWRTGLVSLLLCTLAWLAGLWLPQLADAPWYPLMLGMLFIVGFAYSVVNGMLYKIVPFLVWYHLQQPLSEQGRKAPNVRQIITDHVAKQQCYAHLLALALLVAAPLWPQLLAYPAAIAFGVSSCWLGINLLRAVRIYQLSLVASKPAPGHNPATA